MKKIFFALFLIFFITTNLLAREKGWVSIPKSPDSSLSSFKMKNSAKKTEKAPLATVYDNQPLITEKELISFINILPQFRSWARQSGEEAHPILSPAGKPDFYYTAKVPEWIARHNFTVSRFFNIMGKMAAGMVIIEEGNDLSGTRPKDMPDVLPTELELVKKHFSDLREAGKNL